MQALHPSKEYVQMLESIGLKQAINNVDTTLDTLLIENQLIPVTLNQTEYSNSYVCSPYTAYISYAKEELKLIKSPLQRKWFKILIKFSDYLLRWARINQTVSINNWLVSTNLPPNWSQQTISALTNRLLQNYPNHSFNIRSLNRHTHSVLMDNLEQTGWILLPARQVYLFDNQERNWWQRSHTKRDQKLLAKTNLILLQPDEHTREHFTEIQHCFHKLFIEKHSSYNPQFSAAYLFEMHNKGLMRFFSFQDPESGRILGSIGLFTQQEIITTPMVGYDTSQPQELGLYRLLMAVLLKETYESGQMMNLSSGAGNFKRARGGLPVIEYTAFYVDHLPFHRNLILHAFAGLMNRYAPTVFAKNEI